MKNLFEKDFESMLRRYGDAVEDKKKFTGLIKDFFPPVCECEKYGSMEIRRPV